MRKQFNHGSHPWPRGLIPLLGLVFCLAVPYRSMAYVMPAEQILGLMAKNFSIFNAVTLDQSVREGSATDNDVEISYREKVWMKSPNYYHSERQDGTGKETYFEDQRYLQLLMAGSNTRFMALLSDMGIDLKEVAFDRVNETVVYRIGGKNPEIPKLFIEKRRFLPILLEYRESGWAEGPMITIRFGDYRRVKEGWYPYEVTYSRGDHVLKTYRILDLKTQGASSDIPSPSSKDSVTAPHPSPSSQEETQEATDTERLKNILKAFEEKYR